MATVTTRSVTRLLARQNRGGDKATKTTATSSLLERSSSKGHGYTGGVAVEPETGERIVFGSTDEFIALRDKLTSRAMIVGCLVAFLLVLLIQKHTGLSPLVAMMPVFLFVIVVEIIIQRVSGFTDTSTASKYTVSSMICSVSAGVIQQIAGVFNKKFLLMLGVVPYDYLFSKYGTQVGGQTTQRLLALVFQDLGYYFAHRTYHQIQVGWMFHSIHHNQDHYNFATALRQSWGNTFTSFVFYLPLALFINPGALQWAAEWNLIYQFWVHTCLVRRTWNWFEYIFSTPSHHRVHHDRRLHKNFGGIFITWDRIFGTFLDETSLPKGEKLQEGDPTRLEDGEEVSLFGVMVKQENYLIDLLQLQHIFKTFGSLFKAKSLRQVVKRAVEGAGYYSAASLGEERGTMPRIKVSPERRLRFMSNMPLAGKVYSLVHFHIAVLIFIAVSVDPKVLEQSLLQICGAYGPVVACLCSLALLNDGSKVAPYIEAGRCLLTSYSILVASATENSTQELFGFFHLFSGLVALLNPNWLTAAKTVYSAAKEH